MKKVLFLMLFLIILGAASVKAQVRIGGNGAPNAAAVLDLNTTDAINNGTKGLALPRVSLTNATTALTGTPTLDGMLVYNTNATMTGGSGVGIYYWVTNKWVKMLNSDFTEGDGVVGNELTDTIAGGGLNKTGAGTAASPYKVGIKAGGVTTSMIADGAVTGAKIATVPADSGLYLMSTGSTWVPQQRYNSVYINPTSYTTTTPGTTSWQTVINTTVNVTIQNNRITQLTVTGIRETDLCIVGYTSVIATTWTDAVYLFNLQGSAVSGNMFLRCYRPA